MSISIRVAFILALALLHVFLYFVLFKNVSTSPMIRHFGKLLLLLNFLCILVFFKLYHTQMNDMAYTFLSSTLGVFWISFNVALFVLAITLCIRFGFGAFVLHKYHAIILFGAWCSIFFLSTLGFFINAKNPKVIEENVVLQGLKQPLKIALLTDMHIDVLMSKEKVAQVVAQTNNLKPDLIFLVGDIVDNYYHIVEDSVKELGKLNAKYGTYYVLGNHEYYYDTYTILKTLNSLGITTLINQTIVLHNLSLNIAGIADLVGKSAKFKESILAPDLTKTLEYADKRYPTILLSHQPKITKSLQGENINLIVSGHTHGGQIFPFQLLVMLDQPFVSGLHTFKHGMQQSQIYVSRGVGWWGMPMRLFHNREINLLHLIPESSL